MAKRYTKSRYAYELEEECKRIQAEVYRLHGKRISKVAASRILASKSKNNPACLTKERLLDFI